MEAWKWQKIDALLLTFIIKGMHPFTIIEELLLHYLLLSVLHILFHAGKQ
jgi:hypothetical protein